MGGKLQRTIFVALMLLVVTVAEGRVLPAADAPPISFALPENMDGDINNDYFSRYLLNNAYAMIKADNYFQARNFIERTLKEHPDNPFLLRIDAYLLIRLKYWPEIDRVLTLLLDAVPDDPYALVWRGYARFMMRDGGGAEQDLIRLQEITASPDIVEYTEKTLSEVREFNKRIAGASAAQWEAIRQMESQLEEQNDADGLESFYSGLLEDPATSVYGLMARGLLRFEQGRTEEGEQDFAEAIGSKNAGDDQVEEMRAIIDNMKRERDRLARWDGIRKKVRQLEEENDTDGLLTLFGDLVREDDFRTYALSSRGFVLLGMGMLEDARSDLREALQDDSLDAKTCGEIAATVATINDNLRLDAEWNAIWNQVTKLEDADDDAALEKLFTDLIGSDRYRHFAYSSRGFLHLKRGESEKALRDLEEALAQDDADGDANVELAGEIARIREEIRLKKEWDDIQKRVASLEDVGDEPALEKLFTDLLGNDRYRRYAYSSRGFLRLKRGENAEALRDLEEALAQNDVDADANMELAGEIARIREEIRLAKEWSHIQNQVAALQEKEDADALERLYTKLAKQERYRVYALSSRGFLWLEQQRFDEAERDFREALRHAEKDSRLREDINLALENIDMEREVARYEASGDKEKLEAYYTELLEKPAYRERALIARGYLRLGMDKQDEAEADFRRSLALPDLSERARRDVDKVLRDLAEARRREQEWKDATERVAALEKANDLAAIDMLLSEILSDQPGNSYALAMRGMNRVSLGWAREGALDLLAALKDDKLDSEYRKTLDETLLDVNGALAAGRYPKNPRGVVLLTEVGVAMGEKERDTINRLLMATTKLLLSEEQRGTYLHYLAETRWLDERYDEAAALHSEAAALLRDEDLRSESLWKLAEYFQKKRDNRKLAVQYAREAVSAKPDSAWGNARAGYLFRAYDMNAEAVRYFEKALATSKLKPEEVTFHRELATAYLMLGDRAAFHQHMERHIDTGNDRLAKEVSGEAILAVHRDREFNANAAKRVRGYSYLFSSRFDNNDYLIQSLNEVYLRITGFNRINVEAYFQAVGALASSFSGTYYNSSTGGYGQYSGKQGLNDTLKVATGLRVTLPRGFSLSLDRVFKIGREAENDVRLRGGYYWGMGTTWNPVKSSWNNVTAYADAVYSIEHKDFTAFSEFKAGRSLRLDWIAEKLVATPFAGMTLTCNGKDAPASERWAVEVGPGLALKKWMREDAYNASRSSWEIVAQYRFGLTKNRQNVFSFNLAYAF